jgi:prepilin-type processing-associated H-X9-DG protein
VPLRKGLENCAADWENNYGFASDHAVGANFAFADGSVRFISNAIEIDTYRALGGISEGVVASVPD